MRWQDVVLGAVSLMFLAALVPMVARRTPVPPSTAAMTGGGLLVMCVVDLTLGLWFTALLSMLMGFLWLSLLDVSA